MITKKYTRDGRKCDVRFDNPPEMGCNEAYLCGDFTDWIGERMEPQADGSFTLRRTLAAKNHYQFRYHLDGERWENDPQADGQIANPFGSEDSVLEL